MGIFDLFKKPVDIEHLINSRDLAGLKDCLKDSDPAVQIQAASALAGFGEWEGLAFLNTCLRNPKDAIRLAAIEALGDCCDDRAVDSLIPLLKSDNPEIVETVRLALSHYDTPAAVNALQTTPEPDLSTTVADQQAVELNLTPADPIMGVNPYSDQIRDVAPTGSVDRAARDLFILAESHEEEGRYSQALDEINKVLSHAPGWADAYNLRGIIQEDLDKPYQAMLSYQWAVKLDSSLQAAASNLAELIREYEILSTPLDDWLNDSVLTNDWEERADAVCALNQRPEPEALQAVINALQDTDIEVATIALEALQANPHPEARQALLDYFGAEPGANAELVEPGDHDSFAALSQAGAARKTDTWSDTLLEPVAIPEPMSVEDCLRAADFHCENADYDRAYLLVLYADLLDPGNPDVQNQRGIIHECREEFIQADYAYRRAIDMDPSFREARTNLEELEQEFGAPMTDPMIMISDLNEDDDALVMRSLVTLSEMGAEDAAEYIQPLVESENLKIAVAAALALSHINRQAYLDSIRYVYNRLGFFPGHRAITTQPENVFKSSTRVTAERAELLPLLFSPAHPEWMLSAAQNEFDRMAELNVELLKQSFSGESEIRDLFFHVVYTEVFRRYNPDMFVDILQQMDGRVREIDVVLARVFEGWLADPATVISKQMLTAWSTIPDLATGDAVIYSMDAIRRLASARMK